MRLLMPRRIGASAPVYSRVYTRTMEKRLSSIFGPDADTSIDIAAFERPHDVYRPGHERIRVEYLKSAIENMIKGTYGVVHHTHGISPHGAVEWNRQAGVMADWTMLVTSDGRTSVCSAVSSTQTCPLIRLADRTLEVMLYEQDRQRPVQTGLPSCTMYNEARWETVSTMVAPIIRRCVRAAEGAVGISYFGLFGTMALRAFGPLIPGRAPPIRTIPYVDSGNHSRIYTLDRGVRDAFTEFWEDPRTAHIRGIADNTARVDPGITNDPRAYRAMMAEGADDMMSPAEDYPAALDTAADRAERPWMYEK